MKLNKNQRKIVISFNSKKVDNRHSIWLEKVKKRTGLKELNPLPYWGFDDIFYKVGSKLSNCFYIEAKVKKESKNEVFKYDNIYQLSGLSINKFLNCLEKGFIFIDFDARTGHNHGTKFRFRKNQLPALYENIKKI